MSVPAPTSRPADTPSSAPGAPTVTVLAVGGTGETSGDDTRLRVSGLLAGVTDALDDRFRSRWVSYPASYGPSPHPYGMSYAESLALGTESLLRRIASTPGPLMLIGYSQGAVVIRRALHELLSAGGADAVAVLDRIHAVGFVADPHQPPGAVPGCSGWGVAGPGVPLPSDIPAFWVGAADDMICNAGADSLIRDIADLTSSLAVRAWRAWLLGILTLLRANAFQNAQRTHLGPRQWLRDIGRLRSAMVEILGYLPARIRWRGRILRNGRGGRHTSYAREPYRVRSVTDPDSTGCQVLAAWLQVCATYSVPERAAATTWPMPEGDGRADAA